MNSSVVALVSASISALILAPVVGYACRLLGIVDRPDGHRKLHARPVPLTGGPTVLLSIVVLLEEEEGTPIPLSKSSEDKDDSRLWMDGDSFGIILHLICSGRCR